MPQQAHAQSQDEFSLPEDEVIRQSLALAATARAQGEFGEAEKLYRAILALRRDHADALHGFGLLAHQVGQDALAAELIGLALGRRDDPTFRVDCARALLSLGRLNEAMSEIFKALTQRPDDAPSLALLGAVQDRLGLSDAAEASFRRAVALAPDDIDARTSLATLLRRRGDDDAAAQCLRQALEIRPESVELLTALGGLLREQGNIEEAIERLDRALALRPDHAGAYVNRGQAWLVKQTLYRAEADFRCAIAIEPDCAPAWCGLAGVFLRSGRNHEAIEHYQKAIALDRACPGALRGAAVSLLKLRRCAEARARLDEATESEPPAARAQAQYGFGEELMLDLMMDEAVQCFDRALAHDPGHCGALNARAHVDLYKGDPAAALRGFDAALDKEPNQPGIWSNRLMTMHYLESVGDDDITAFARRFGARFERPAASARRASSRDPDRKLRIGYVSGDFLVHPVGVFFRRVLESHDKAAFEIVCYSNNSYQDDLTRVLRSHAGAWRQIEAVGDDEAAATIAADDIDILVDLSGHTGRNRLPVFARKPAPLQATWLGYFGTTGLEAMDYVILDPVTAPEGAGAGYVETIVRLPHGRFCYDTQLLNLPLAEAPPSARRGHVTFGSFNNVAKIGDGVIALWSRLLAEVPDSRLVLKWRCLNFEEVRNRLRDAFARHGVAGERIELRPYSQYRATAREYDDIDIALDTFPFGGATTSCDALYMGAPVVTLPTQRTASRQTASLLHYMGHNELVASSPDDYVARAAALARDPERLRVLRSQLRASLVGAPFNDPAKFTAGLERAYRGMWRRFVDGAAPQPFDVSPD